MDIFVNNGKLSKSNDFSNFDMSCEELSEIVDDINEQVKNILESASIYDFKPVCYENTIHLIYTGMVSNLNGIELVTGVRLDSYKNYTIKTPIIDREKYIHNVSTIIVSNIIDGLENIECHYSVSNKEQLPPIAKIMEKYKKYCKKHEVFIDKKPSVSRTFQVFMTVAENPIISYGNSGIRFKYINDTLSDFQGINAELFKFLVSSKYEEYIKPFLWIKSKWDGNFTVYDDRFNFSNGKIRITNPKSILDLLSSGEDVSDYIKKFDEKMEEYTEGIKEKERKKKEEREKMEEEKKKKREEISKSELSKDIYNLVLDSDPLSINYIVQHLHGGKTNEHIAHPELFGKWCHCTLKKIRSYVEDMINADIFGEDERTGPYGTFSVLYVNIEISFVLEETEELTPAMIEKISNLAREAAEGQEKLKELCSIIVNFPNSKLINTAVANALREQNFNFGFLNNGVLTSLYKYLE